MARRSLALTASELPLLRQKLQMVIEMIDLCLTDRQRPIHGGVWHLRTHLPISAIVHAVYDCAQRTTVIATITASNSNRRQPSLIGCFWPIAAAHGRPLLAAFCLWRPAENGQKRTLIGNFFKFGQANEVLSSVLMTNRKTTSLFSAPCLS